VEGESFWRARVDIFERLIIILLGATLLISLWDVILELLEGMLSAAPREARESRSSWLSDVPVAASN